MQRALSANECRPRRSVVVVEPVRPDEPVGVVVRLLDDRHVEPVALELSDGTSDADIEGMCRKLLANTVIENFRIERMETAQA